MNDIIQYKLQNSDEWIKATVTGRAGKATENKYWYNIKEDLTEEKKSINLEQVDWELLNGVANVNIVQKNECRINKITEAKLTELEKLCHFDTYQEVQDCGQYTLSTRWVITDKDGKTKARLVVRGFEEEYFMPRDSPTVGKGTMRIFLAISSSNNLTYKQQI